jgi:hypothetical protein
MCCMQSQKCTDGCACSVDVSRLADVLIRMPAGSLQAHDATQLLTAAASTACTSQLLRPDLKDDNADEQSPSAVSSCHGCCCSIECGAAAAC